MRKKLFLLAGAAELADSFTASPMDSKGQRCARTCFPAHLHSSDIDWPREFEAAEFFRKAHTGKSLFKQFPNILTRKLCLHIYLASGRLDLLLEKIPQRV